MITQQETFDTVVAHARQQGVEAMDVLVCKYRYNGLKCFGGCLIPDELYKPEFEGNAVSFVRGDGLIEITAPGKLIADLGHDLKLVKRLQRIHDGIAIGCWETNFKNVAEEYKLTYTPPAN